MELVTDFQFTAVGVDSSVVPSADNRAILVENVQFTLLIVQAAETEGAVHQPRLVIRAGERVSKADTVLIDSEDAGSCGSIIGIHGQQFVRPAARIPI